MTEGFAVWITGLPASGKSSIARELAGRLRERGIAVVVLGSDEMRRVLTAEPTYTAVERDRFYAMLAGVGEAVTKSGVNVLFDATANLRAYRDRARRRIPRFVEAYVDCPLETCRDRDPKGIYRHAGQSASGNVPGIQAPYEPPLSPDVRLDCRHDPARSAEAVLRTLAERGCLPL